MSNGHIAGDGDRMDAPSEATETDQLEEIAERLEGDLIVAQAKLGELKSASQKATLTIEQVGRFLHMAGTALEVLVPILQSQVQKVSVDEIDAGTRVVAETNLASFLSLLKGVSDEQINLGRLKSLVSLVEGKVA